MLNAYSLSPHFKLFACHFCVLWEEEGVFVCVLKHILGFVIAVSFDVYVIFSLSFRTVTAVTSQSGVRPLSRSCCG